MRAFFFSGATRSVMLSGIVLFLSFLTRGGCSGSDSWGYQNHGFGGLIDVDNDGYLYFTGLSSQIMYAWTMERNTLSNSIPHVFHSSPPQTQFSSNDYLVSKISPHGNQIWTYHHDTNGRGLNPVALGFGSDSVYVTGNYPQPFITKLNRTTGVFIWERINFLQMNTSSWLNIAGVTVDEHNDPYVLFHREPNWWQYDREYSSAFLPSKNGPAPSHGIHAENQAGETNDYVTKLDGSNGQTKWEVKCFTNQEYKIAISTFVQIISTPPPSSSALNTLTISGQFYDQNLWKQMTLINTMSGETGETLTMTESTAPFSEKNSNKAQYGKNEYRLQTVYDHVYGKDSSIQGGVIINKNWCRDGELLLPVTSTTSRALSCPGLSWSLGDHHGRQVSCDYYYARGGYIAVVLIFLFPLSLAIGLSSFYRIPAIHILTSLLSSLVFSSDLAYVMGVVFTNLLFFLLSLFFLLLPAIHLLQYIYQATRTHGSPTTRRRIYLLFDPPGAMTPLFVLSAREDGRVPYFREIRCLPSAIQSSEDFMLLIGGWLLAGFAQLLYGIFWVVSHVVPLIPWLAVHVPWFLLIYFSGYVLYRLSLLQHQPIKERWLLLFLHPPDTHEGTLPTTEASTGDRDLEDQDHDVRPTIPNDGVSGELIVTSVSVLLLGLVGELVVQIINNQKMGHSSLLTALCLILKCLFLLNILNRFAIVYGPSVVPHLREMITSLFPNYLSSPFVELGSVETAAGTSQPTELLNEIAELKLQIQTLKERLSLYEGNHEGHQQDESKREEEEKRGLMKSDEQNYVNETDSREEEIEKGELEGSEVIHPFHHYGGDESDPEVGVELHEVTISD
jgi:uncharacterized membrane protein YcgQ (UPF0703/DUF1980 family)